MIFGSTFSLSLRLSSSCNAQVTFKVMKHDPTRKQVTNEHYARFISFQYFFFFFIVFCFRLFVAALSPHVHFVYSTAINETHEQHNGQMGNGKQKKKKTRKNWFETFLFMDAITCKLQLGYCSMYNMYQLRSLLIVYAWPPICFFIFISKQIAIFAIY